MKIWIYCEGIWYLLWRSTVEVWFGYQDLPFHEGILLFSQISRWFVSTFRFAVGILGSLGSKKKVDPLAAKEAAKTTLRSICGKRSVFGEVDLRVVNWQGWESNLMHHVWFFCMDWNPKKVDPIVTLTLVVLGTLMKLGEVLQIHWVSIAPFFF